MELSGSELYFSQSSIELNCSSTSSCSSTIYHDFDDPISDVGERIIHNQTIQPQQQQPKKSKGLNLRPTLMEVLSIGPKFLVGPYHYYKSFNRGNYSKVRVLKDSRTGEFFVLKEAHNVSKILDNQVTKSKNPTGQKLLEDSYAMHLKLVNNKSRWGIQSPPIEKVIIEGVYQDDYVAVIEELYDMDLEDYRKNNNLTLPDLLLMIEQMISALVYCHGIGVVRTDQKSSNYLVKRKLIGDDTYLLVHRCDFSDLHLDEYNESNPPPRRRLHNRLTTVMQEYHQATVYVDTGRIEEFKTLVMQQEIFAMGIVLYELIMGHDNFPYPYTFNEIRLGVDHKPITREDIPKKLSELVYAMLKKEPQDRPDARTVMEQFQSVLVDYPEVFEKSEKAKSLLGYA